MATREPPSTSRLGRVLRPPDLSEPSPWPRSRLWIWLLLALIFGRGLLLLGGCGSTGPAPVDGWDWKGPVPRGYYLVRSGDTLSEIALDRRVSTRDLVRWNRLKPPYTIYAGKLLRVARPDGTRVAATGSPPPDGPVGRKRPAAQAQARGQTREPRRRLGPDLGLAPGWNRPPGIRCRRPHPPGAADRLPARGSGSRRGGGPGGLRRQWTQGLWQPYHRQAQREIPQRLRLQSSLVGRGR